MQFLTLTIELFINAQIWILLLWTGYQQCTEQNTQSFFNPLNAELNPIRHLLALVGARHIVHVSRIRVNPLNAELNPSRHLLALVGARHIVHVSRIRVKYPLPEWLDSLWHASSKLSIPEVTVSVKHAACFICLIINVTYSVSHNKIPIRCYSRSWLQ